MTKRESYYVTGFAGAAHTFSHLFLLLYATIVLVLEKRWGLSYSTLLALSIPGTVMFGAGALPAGWLADRWSSSGMMAIAFFGLGGAAILAGFAQGPLSIGSALTLIGVFAAIYHPVGIPWLVKHAANRGRALGINGVFGSAGTAGAAVIAGGLAELLGWRFAFFIPGAVAILFGGAFVYAIKTGRVVEHESDVAPEPPPTASDTKRAFLVMTVTVACTGLIYQATAYSLPKLFSERLSGALDHSIAGVGVMVSLCYVAAAVAQIVGGELADRFSLKNVYLFSQFSQVPVLLVAYFLKSPILVLVAAFMVALSVIGTPAENALLARFAPPAWRARAFGVKFSLTLGVSAGGVALVPILYRITGSISPIFFFLMAFAAIAGLGALVLPSDSRRRPRATTSLPLTAAE